MNIDKLKDSGCAPLARQTWLHVRALPFTDGVTGGRSFILSGPEFPYLQSVVK